MAELAAGPHATDDRAERAQRQDRLQRAEAAFDPLPFDGEPLGPTDGPCPRSWGAVARLAALEPSTG